MALNCMEWECCKCTNYMCICRYVLILNGWKFKSMWFFPSILLSIITSLVSSKPTVFSCSLMSDSSKPRGLLPARLLCPWNFPDKNTGVGCHFLDPDPEDLPDPGIEPTSLVSPALAGDSLPLCYLRSPVLVSLSNSYRILLSSFFVMFLLENIRIWRNMLMLVLTELYIVRCFQRKPLFMSSYIYKTLFTC